METFQIICVIFAMFGLMAIGFLPFALVMYFGLSEFLEDLEGDIEDLEVHP